MGLLRGIAAVLMCCLVLTGCDQRATPPASAGGPDGLPAPSEVARHSSDATLDEFLVARGPIYGLCHNMQSAAGGAHKPHTGNGFNLDNMAYAFYEIPLGGMQPEAVLHVRWDKNWPTPDATAFVALANRQRDAWKWGTYSGWNTYEFGDLTNYVASGEDKVLACVLLTGDDEHHLYSLDIGWQWKRADIGPFDPAFYSFAAEVNGKPAAIVSTTSNFFYYRVADDAKAIAWSPLTYVVTPYPSSPQALLDVEGRPAVVLMHWLSNQDPSEQKFSYMRALDDSGTSWSTPQPIPAPAWSRPECKVDGNLPAILFRRAADYSSSVTALYFVKALDPDGLAWAAPVEVPLPAGSELAFSDVHMEFAGDKPCVIYRLASDHVIYATSAVDVDGQVWNAPVPVVLQYSLWDTGLVAGRPAIICVDNLTLQLHVATAADAQLWAPPRTFDHFKIGLEDVHMLSWDDKPVVAYEMYGGRFITVLQRALDAEGTSWGYPIATSYGVFDSKPHYICQVGARPAFTMAEDGHIWLELPRAP